MKKKLIMVGVLTLVAMLVFGGCGVGGDQGSPENVVEAYFKAFQAKDFQKAISLTTGGETLSEQDIENLRLVFEHVQIKNFDIGKAEILTNEEAIVPVTITTVFDGDESIAADDVRVLKIDGKWFIDDGLVDDDDDWGDRDPMQQPAPDLEDIELEMEDLEDLFDSEDLEGLLDPEEDDEVEEDE